MARKAQVVHGDDGWRWVAGNPTQWRLNPSGFIEEQYAASRDIVVGQPFVRTTDPTNPNAVLAQRVWEEYGELCVSIGNVFDVPVPVLVATICNESAGNPKAFRDEGYDVSIGLTQVLTSTAILVGRWFGWPRIPGPDPVIDAAVEASWFMPMRRVTKLDRSEIHHWRRFLGAPEVSIAFGAMTHKLMEKERKTNGDPVLAYASYNSGGIYLGNNRYGLEATVAAVEAFVLFYNDFINLNTREKP